MSDVRQDELMPLEIKYFTNEDQYSKVTTNGIPEQNQEQIKLNNRNQFENLYQLEKSAQEKKMKNDLIQKQKLSEAKEIASRSKIDINSQKLILKKKEKSLSVILFECMSSESSYQLTAQGVIQFLTKIGIFKDEIESCGKLQTFTEKRLHLALQEIFRFSDQRTIVEQAIFNDLWKLLTLQNDSATSVAASFLFDIVIILLEAQLTKTQMKSIDLISDQIRIQLKKLILLDNKGNEEQKIAEDCLTECIQNLQAFIQTFVIDFRQLYEVRKCIVDQNLRLKSEKQESDQENYSFKPNICKKSKEIIAKSSIGNATSENRYEQLFEYSKHLAQKRKTLVEKEEQKKQQDPSCSFKPKINYKKSQPFYQEEQAHQRLYQNAKKMIEHKEKLRDYYASKKEQCEMEECTFKPQTTDMIQLKQHITVKGEESVIERFTKARQIKQNKENFYAFREEQFKNHDSSKITHPQPFNLNTRNANSENNKIYLYIDVKISKNKKVRLGIKKGDDPHEVAENFGKIHQLNQELKETLEETLKELIENFEQKEDELIE